jgi:hypothetical protein
LAGALLTAVSPLLAQSGRVRFRVTDPVGARVSGAEISLVDKDEKVLLTEHTDSAGTAVFTGVPMGVAQFIVASPGFNSTPVTVTISSGKKEVKVWATLTAGGGVGEIVVLPPRKVKGWWIF